MCGNFILKGFMSLCYLTSYCGHLQIYHTYDPANDHATSFVPKHLERPTCELEDLLQSSRDQHTSSSIFVYGMADGGREHVVQYAIRRVFSHGVRMASVSGATCPSDDAAIISISRQLNVRLDTDKHFSDAMTDIVAQLRNAGRNDEPVVIIVEDIQQYCKGKQVLIYTLLDLMHKEDYFFIFLAVTSNAFTPTLFEKRIVSRLNAKNIYIPPLNLSDLLDDLRTRLTLPTAFDELVSLQRTSRSAHGNCLFDNIPEYAHYASIYNKALFDILGYEGNVGDVEVIQMLRARIAWGYPIEYFYTSIRSAFLQLAWTLTYTIDEACSQLVLSRQMFLQSIKQYLDTPTLANRVQRLNQLELQVLATITHLQLRKGDITANTNAMTKRFKGYDLAVSDIIKTFNKLTNNMINDEEIVLQTILSLESQNIVMLLTIANSCKDVGPLDGLRLLHHPRYLQEIFANEDENTHVVIARRIRDAVLHPEAPIIMSRVERTSTIPGNDLDREISIAFEA